MSADPKYAPGLPYETQLVARVEATARDLCAAIRESRESGADALVFPALIGVFRDEGFFPADLDLGSLMGLLR